MLLRHVRTGEAGTYLNQIHLVESFVAAGLLDIENGNDVLVVEVPQKLHLTQSS